MPVFPFWKRRADVWKADSKSRFVLKKLGKWTDRRDKMKHVLKRIGGVEVDVPAVLGMSYSYKYRKRSRR